MTIVRPSHTYDDANPPLPGGWAVVDRIARGEQIPVHGDGTSLWTLTHAEDFADQMRSRCEAALTGDRPKPFLPG